MKRALLALALAGAGVLGQIGPAGAASHTVTFKGSGWKLTLTSRQSKWGSTMHGTLAHQQNRYHVEGDWIPAGDAGGDLLRFYGHPFNPRMPLGLVGVATLYNTCNPNCAAGMTYALTPVKPFSIPSYRGTAPLHLTLQHSGALPKT